MIQPIVAVHVLLPLPRQLLGTLVCDLLRRGTLLCLPFLRQGPRPLGRRDKILVMPQRSLGLSTTGRHIELSVASLHRGKRNGTPLHRIL